MGQQSTPSNSSLASGCSRAEAKVTHHPSCSGWCTRLASPAQWCDGDFALSWGYESYFLGQDPAECLTYPEIFFSNHILTPALVDCLFFFFFPVKDQPLFLRREGPVHSAWGSALCFTSLQPPSTPQKLLESYTVSHNCSWKLKVTFSVWRAHLVLVFLEMCQRSSKALVISHI